MITETEPATDLVDAPGATSPLRFVTAASLFDGHDAAINVMRRLIQDSGAEVIHLGHNRSVVGRRARGDPGGRRRDRDQLLPGRPHRVLQVRGGDAARARRRATSACSAAAAARSRRTEIAELEGYGVERIYHPNDGMALGLTGMIDDLVERARSSSRRRWRREPLPAIVGPRTDDLTVAQMLSALEDGVLDDGRAGARCASEWAAAGGEAPVVGITGTGGAGKSTVTDELLLPLRARLPGDAHRRARGRPDPPAHRRRAARRPDPHEQPAQRADLHALDGDAPEQPLDQRDARRRACVPALPAGFDLVHRRDRRASARATPRSSIWSICRSTS